MQTPAAAPSFSIATYGGIFSITRELRLPWYARVLGKAFATYALYRALRGRPLKGKSRSIIVRFTVNTEKITAALRNLQDAAAQADRAMRGYQRAFRFDLPGEGGHFDPLVHARTDQGRWS